MDNTKISYYISRFKDIYNGSPWYGETIVTKLKNVSSTVAFQKPHPKAHSIAELVSHMIYWRKALISRLEGDMSFTASVDNAENWVENEKLKSTGWSAIETGFHATQEKLVTLISKKDDSILTEKFSEKYSYEELIRGVIDHDIYHVGQIGLVRTMIE